jgi:transposase
MKYFKVFPHMKPAELLSILHSQKDIRAFKDWQIIYCVAINVGKTAAELSVLLGVSKSRIYRIIQSYNKTGKAWRVAKQWGGRREERSLMSLEEERRLLKEVEIEALSGQILIHKDIKGKIELKVGREVSDDYVWDLFKRHNWKKKVPRGSHPKSDKDAQVEYKKKFKELVVAKSAEFSNKEDSRAIKLFFQDEARFGRIDTISVRAGFHPRVELSWAINS